MSTIHVEHRHTLGPDEARRRAEEVISEIGDRINADINWEGSTASFKGTGFSGKAHLSDSSIALDVDLSLILRPLKGKIEERIGRWLDKRFT